MLLVRLTQRKSTLGILVNVDRMDFAEPVEDDDGAWYSELMMDGSRLDVAETIDQIEECVEIERRLDADRRTG